MPKVRVHSEWFQTTVAMRCDCGSNRKSRLAAGHDLQVYIWGEYAYAGKWRTVQKVCQSCWPDVIQKLRQHARPCGCTFQLQPRSGYRLASWMTLPADFNTCQKVA